MQNEKVLIFMKINDVSIASYLVKDIAEWLQIYSWFKAKDSSLKCF